MKVTLVGAGPGGIGLLTIRGLEVLQAADIVLYDRFVSDDILAAIPDAVEKIDVGKHAGNHHVPQDTINALLLEKSKQGKNVVRLKGGDPFVFARGGEELELLAENNIPFEVVPGVTSAIAAATYAGIPVTHRDYASSFHVITAHTKNNAPINIDFDALVKLNGTLIFLMGTSVIDDICEKCVSAGMDKDMPAVIVENAAASGQRKFLGTITTLPKIAGTNNVKSPAVIIIGKVCQLSTRYDWFDRKPLRGKRVVVVSIKDGVSNSGLLRYARNDCHCEERSDEAIQETIKQNTTSKLSYALRELGCDVVEIPYLKIAPLIGRNDTLTNKLKNIDDYSWLVFTSRVGVNIFFDYLKEASIDIRGLINVKIACVGRKTEKEVNKRGIKVEYVPDEYNGAALARGLSILVKNGEKLLIARAKDGDRDLTDVLTEAEIAFDDVPIYEKVSNDKTISAVVNGFDFAVFTSSSTVKGFAELAVNMDLSGIKAMCIGDKTAAAARAYGMEVYVSAEATVESMIEKIKEL